MRSSSSNTENYISVYTNNLKDIFKEELNFSIPYNQRPWAWDDKKLKTLWEDIKKTRDDFYDEQVVNTSRQWALKPHSQAIDPHFFGAFVFVEAHDVAGSKILEVVDGQQRLTSLTMIASIIREFRTELQSTATDPFQRSTAQKGVAETLTWLEKNGTAIIKADEQYHNLYEALVITPSTQQDRDSLVNSLSPIDKETKEHSHLIKSFKFIRKIMIEDIEKLDWEEKSSYINSVMQTLAERFMIISSFIKIESFSYKVFTALNAKGQKLTPTDNIKNELFSLSSNQLHPAISQSWRTLKTHTLRGDVGDFLRKRLISENGEIFSTNILYETINKKELKTPVDILATINKWSNDAKLLKEIFNCSHASSDANIEWMIKSILTLNISLCEIMILKAAKLFLPADKKSFTEIVQLTLNLAFRKIIICRDKTSDLEMAFSKAVKNLTVDPNSIQNVKNIFRKYSDDGNFKKRFAIHVEKNTKIQYYILFEIEKHLAGAAGSGLQPFPHTVTQHIEHILPQKLSKIKDRNTEWAWARQNSDLHNKLVNRLGNLIILEGPINSHVSNFEFNVKQTGNQPNKKVKRKAYADSSLKLPKALSNLSNYTKWEEKEIDEQQLYLSDLALRIWAL